MFKRSTNLSTGSLFACALMALFALSCSSGGINGKWIADLPGRDGQTRQQTFNFKAEGNKLTGTVSGRQGETPISDGEINGDDISFSVTQNFRGNEVKVLYKGKLAGKEIKFTRTREGGNREGGNGEVGDNQPPQGPMEFTAKKA
ncbi:MAG TPA: hypothetical protein VN937_27535 [Blastocatellia bacterium]|nr:hypothetical protein [Blastocatellia bacterium]